MDNFLQMFDGYHSTGDLFEVVRRAGWDTAAMEVQPQVSGLPMSPPRVPQVLPEPPSEKEMAAWLYPIVRGEEFVANHPSGNGDVYAGLAAVDQHQVPAKEPSKQLMEKVRARSTKGKCAEGTTSDSSERKTTLAGTRERKSSYLEAHSLREKRRRCRVNESIKTLQQLVPGCAKCNQASTLDRTIQYMKSLQQQVQSMSSVAGCSMKPVAAVYPVAPPPYSIVAPRPPPEIDDLDTAGTVPFARTPIRFPLVRHAAVMMPAAPMIQRPPTPPPNTRPEEAGKR